MDGLDYIFLLSFGLWFLAGYRRGQYLERKRRLDEKIKNQLNNK